MQSWRKRIFAALSIFLAVVVLSGGTGSAVADSASHDGIVTAVAAQPDVQADEEDGTQPVDQAAAEAADQADDGAATQDDIAADAAADDVEPQIIGGNPPTQDYPGGAKVTLKYDAPAYGREAWHTCGASLIDGMHMITAAHCVTDPPAALMSTDADLQALAVSWQMDAKSLAIPTKDKSFWVRVGSNNINAGIMAHARVEWTHPDWAWATIPGADVSDIAVLELDRYIDEYELPIAPRAPRLGETVYELGFGLTMANGGGEVPTGIRELRTKVIAPVNCADAGMGPRDVCVDNPNGTKGTCNGDSGSPLLIQIKGVWYTVGVLSRNASPLCGDVPSIYTLTPSYTREVYDVLLHLDPAPPAAVGKPAPPLATQPYEPGNP